MLLTVTHRYSVLLTDTHGRTTKFQKMTVRMDPDGTGFPKSRTKDEDENDYDKEQNDKGDDKGCRDVPEKNDGSDRFG